MPTIGAADRVWLNAVVDAEAVEFAVCAGGPSSNDEAGKVLP